MAGKRYSVELCRELVRTVKDAGLSIMYRPSRYEAGDVLDLEFTIAWPEKKGRGRFRIEKFVGGGFAGQVYRCVLESIGSADDLAELKQGGVYAVKMMIPPSRFSRVFRDILYWIGFQTPFSAQINLSACRAGLLWQKAARLAAGKVFGCEDAVADVYATFFDSALGSYGEIREWVEGRTWRLEPDLHPLERRGWRSVDPRATGSPEFVAKRRYMAGFVEMLHAMGARELARQYEWWTMKSQPNTLKRHGCDDDPAAGLCAVDFRAGLVLLPFLPMSIGDIGLILAGLRARSLVQFDRCDFRKLRAFAVRNSDVFGPYEPMIDALRHYDNEYRRSMPDITHQGFRLLADSNLRHDVRKGLAGAYLAAGRIDADFARHIPGRPGRFLVFQLLMGLPLLGRPIRRYWGDATVREHVRRILCERGYMAQAMRAGASRRLVEWHRSGRTGEQRTRLLAAHPGCFWLQRCTLGFLPAGLHRALAEPGFVVDRIRAGIGFIVSFYRDPMFREKWFTDLVHDGYADGMLDEPERDAILSRVKDPFIVKYLKSLAIHFATLPVTQIVSVLTGAVVVAWMLSTGRSWQVATGTFFAIVAFFQVTPISPGSLCRGLYVVYVIIRDRNFRDYMIAAPVAFVKYFGYLAFPLQMATTYPALSRFMASRFATDMVHVVPVFGEKGALLEHWVFDWFFNFPRIFGRWARPRIKGFLDVWLLIGLVIWLVVFKGCDVDWITREGIKLGTNLVIGVTALFILPRVLFYPILTRKKR